MKRKKVLISISIVIACIAAAILLCFCRSGNETNKTAARVQGMYGVNEKITGGYDEELSAKCSNGTFVGTETDGIIAYKGIPYAKQPVGDLRWKAPEEQEPDDGVYEAYYFGKSPIQTEWPSEAGSYYEQGEDCLTLNVWTDSSVSEDKTVMVFFHGGSYGWGGTSDPIYDGQNFVEAHPDVVLVTVEYRTGIMGFIDFSSVEGGNEYADSGNLGLLDMVCSLKWIQQNIEAFGGNPDNVTIFGESAGAGAVSLLPLMEGTEGLFQRVIAESGSVALTYSKEECKRLTEMLLDETGAENMEDLLALSEAELMEANEALNDYNNFPERDGVVLPENLYEAYQNGEAADVDLLIGTNADETRYWISEMGYYVPGISGKLIYSLGMPVMYESDLKKFSAADRKYANAFMELQNDKKIWNITEFYNELLFRVPALYQAQADAENGGTAYVYYWNYPSAVDSLGACHAVELAYVFNNTEETIYTGDNIDQNLADTVQNMWVNFAKTGDPSVESLTWSPYSSEAQETMILDQSCHMETDWLKEQQTEIEPLLKYGINGCYTTIDFYVPYVYKFVAIMITAVCLIILVITWRVRKKRKRGSPKCMRPNW